ncbi:MAG: hypothetical protein M1834_007783 [Cirrosporium novae-zelandiae]|nr:MAG: hypothetical protein M1834_007783 [Cirrosporium novae-zelandiae]
MLCFQDQGDSLQDTSSFDMTMSDDDMCLPEHDALTPPTFPIYLYYPPSKRYIDIAKAYRDELSDMSLLFDEVIPLLFPHISVSFVKSLAQVFLTRLFSREEREELKGMSIAAGIPLYLLVGFNTILDFLIGCSSGGVRTQDQDGPEKMIHFRTLDWGMEHLRSLVIRLEYIRAPGDKPIAHAITYAGFIGVLTGVRKGLSMSLNVRPTHDRTRFLADRRLFLHNLLVLCGWRQSISSLLRSYLLSPEVPDLVDIAESLPRRRTTPAHLIFCDGKRTMIFEKDYRSAVILSAQDFITITNHDINQDGSDKLLETANLVPSTIIGMKDIFDESVDRRKCMTSYWKAHVKSVQRQRLDEAKRKRIRGQRRALEEGDDSGVSIKTKSLIGWVNRWPITNESTHYATLMDPTDGRILWAKAYPTPPQEPVGYLQQF